MKTIAAHCDNCGAPLDIPEEAKQVTCIFCESRLEVVRTDSVVTTTMIEDLHARLTNAEDEIEMMKLRERLRALDQRWHRYRARYSTNGQTAVPTRRGSRNAINFGTILLVVAPLDLLIGPTIFFPLILTVGLISLIGGLITIDSARRFEAARTRFLRSRRKLTRRIAELRRRATLEQRDAGS